jgi:hypothetical protein
MSITTDIDEGKVQLLKWDVRTISGDIVADALTALITTLKSPSVYQRQPGHNSQSREQPESLTTWVNNEAP